MDSNNQAMGLLFLFSELAAREWTLKLGRECVFLPEQMGDGDTFFMPRNFDRCLHLPLGAQGRRCALLVQQSDAMQLVSQAKRRGTVAEGHGNGDEGIDALFQDVLARPFALLAFLAGQPLFLQGISVQDVDTTTRCRIHEVAFRSQKMAPISMTLNVCGLDEMPVVLLVPEPLLTQAIVGLSDPDAQAEVDRRFLEYAEDIEREVAAWLASLDEQPDVGEGSLDSPEVDEVAPSRLDGLLDAFQEEFAEDEADVVLNAPEDLVYAKLFFPDGLAEWSKVKFGREITVEPVEMASLPMSRMGEEPPGMLAQIAYSGAFQAETAFVFPEALLTALSRTSGRPVKNLVGVLMEPGVRAMRALGASPGVEVKAVAPVDFSKLSGDGTQLAIRIRYRMSVGDAEPVAFVQYATVGFINRMIDALVDDTVILQANRRNLMLAFVGLNASLGAAVLAHPDLAGTMMASLLGAHYADVLDEDEEGIFGFCVFESLVELTDRDLRVVLDGPEVREKGAVGLACALSLTSANLRAKVLRNLSANRRADVLSYLKHTYEREEVRERWLTPAMAKAIREINEATRTLVSGRFFCPLPASGRAGGGADCARNVA